MEMGTSSEAELQRHGTQMGKTVRAATGPNSTGVWIKSTASECLSCRSGDDMADGGHMIVPSIGQVMWIISTANCASSVAIDTSGTVHIVPMI